MIILKWIKRVWNRIIWLRMRSSGDLSCEHSNEHFGYVKGDEFLV
jgi:hypothetical protein